MKTDLLHQLYQLLGLEKEHPTQPDEADSYSSQEPISVWNQSQDPFMIKIAFKHVRQAFKIKDYVKKHREKNFTAYSIPLQEWDPKFQQWRRTSKYRIVDYRDILKFFEVNKKFRRRYWSAEERLMRIIETGDDR